MLSNGGRKKSQAGIGSKIVPLITTPDTNRTRATSTKKLDGKLRSSASAKNATPSKTSRKSTRAPKKHSSTNKTNKAKKESPRIKGVAPTLSVASATPDRHNRSKSSRGTFTIKFVSRLSLTGPRGSMQNERSNLLRSLMPGRSTAVPGSSPRNDGGFVKEIFDVYVVGKFYSMYVDVYFGEVDNRSGPCRLHVDAGSSTSWVTDKAYRKAFRDINVNQLYPEFKGTFESFFSSGENIKGNLHEGTISFLDKRTFVQNQTFGIVDEKLLDSYTRNILVNMGTEGIIGLKPNAHKVRTSKLDEKKIKRSFPTFLDNLKAKDRIPENIVGFAIGLPNEVENGPWEGEFNGELHFGGRRADAYDEATMMEIPTVKKGNSFFDSFYNVKLKLKCGNETIMSTSKATIDSGTSWTQLPSSAVSNYKIEIDKIAGREVIKYKEGGKYLYIKKSDFKYLRDIEFSFHRGQESEASFKLPPTAQVAPPGVFRDGDDTIFLALQVSSNEMFVLGLSWMMWHYFVLDAREEHKKVGIAEITDRKGHRWSSLKNYY